MPQKTCWTKPTVLIHTSIVFLHSKALQLRCTQVYHQIKKSRKIRKPVNRGKKHTHILKKFSHSHHISYNCTLIEYVQPCFGHVRLKQKTYNFFVLVTSNHKRYDSTKNKFAEHAVLKFESSFLDVIITVFIPSSFSPIAMEAAFGQLHAISVISVT